MMQNVEAMGNKELIAALRFCANEAKDTCVDCPMFRVSGDEFSCNALMLTVAADRLELLDATLAEKEAMHKELTAAIAAVAALEAERGPKRPKKPKEPETPGRWDGLLRLFNRGAGK